jgi:amino acid transporter
VSKRLPQRGRDILIVVGGIGILCGLFDITAVLANSGYSLWIFALSTLILLAMGLWCMHMMKTYNTFFGRGRFVYFHRVFEPQRM